MAVTKTINLNFIKALGNKEVDLSTDSFKLALSPMELSAISKYADLSTDELANGNGYTTGGGALILEYDWAVDDNEGVVNLHWETHTVTAAGGTLEFSSAAIYDDTHPDDLAVGIINLGTTVTVTDGNNFDFTQLGFELYQ